MSFSSRNRIARKAPRRDLVEEAPQDLRATLLALLIETHGVLGAYEYVCKFLHEIPDPQIWGASFADGPLRSMVDNLEWYDVFDLLEHVAVDAIDARKVNESFVRCGLAYEM